MNISTRKHQLQTSFDMAERHEFFYPNNISRIILLAMEDILGQHGVHALLNLSKHPELVHNYPPNNLELAFSFTQISNIHAALTLMFGEQGGKAIAIHAGKETFRRGLKILGPILGISDLAFRALPLGIKIKIGLNVFAETMNKFTEQIVRLDEGREQYYWIIERCPFCWNRQVEKPSCHLAMGILQEAANWVSNGRTFHIKQTDSIACGDKACVFSVKKRPIS